MPTNLTAAELAELEERMAALERAVLDNPDATERLTVDAWQAVATTTALLTALREARAEANEWEHKCLHLAVEHDGLERQRDEARALVEALYNMGEYYHYHGDHLEGQIAVCWQCGATDGHAVGCWVGKAETALAAWNAAPHDQLPE